MSKKYNSLKEKIFWETLEEEQIDEHKRIFDEDVFNAILKAMEIYKKEYENL